MTTSAIHQRFMMDIIAELTRSRRDNPGSAGHFNKMNEAMRLLANALTKESSECVREQCINVAIGAIRIALDGCMSVEKARALQGLDHVTAHLQARANEERAAHQI